MGEKIRAPGFCATLQMGAMVSQDTFSARNSETGEQKLIINDGAILLPDKRFQKKINSDSRIPKLLKRSGNQTARRGPIPQESQSTRLAWPRLRPTQSIEPEDQLRKSLDGLTRKREGDTVSGLRIESLAKITRKRSAKAFARYRLATHGRRPMVSSSPARLTRFRS
jgi:hypothetical protein